MLIPRSVRLIPDDITFDRSKIICLDEILADLRGKKEYLFIDNRPVGQYTGEEPDGTGKRGHIKGAVNVPIFAHRNEDMTLKSKEELRVLFEALGTSDDKMIVCYCTSGI